MDRPITSWPARASRAAATGESTRPDMATTMGMTAGLETSSFRTCTGPSSCGPSGSAGGAHQGAQLRHNAREPFEEQIDVRLGVAGAEADADRILGPVRGEPHGPQHVRR